MTNAIKSQTIGAMIWRRDLAIHLAAILLVFLSSACTTQRMLPKDTGAGFSTDLATEVFTTGYSSISEKYIDKISLATLALEGMRGLVALDPRLMVSRRQNIIVLTDNDRAVARFPAPTDNDALKWAALTVEVLAASGKASKQLRAASNEMLFKAVFDGMLSKLDVFSRYAGIEDARKNRAKREGFGGIGIRFKFKWGEFRVTFVMANTPAARAGIKKGDIITYVGQVPVKGLQARQVGAQMRGPIGSLLTLTVRRGQAGPLTFEIERAHIVGVTVTMREKNGIVFLKVRGFNKNTTRNMAKKLKEAKKKLGTKIKGLVLDLRGNPGGLLKQSIRIADLFLAQGQIIRTQGRHPDSIQHYEASGTDLASGTPLAVLVDGKSASAAEIVAAALQDRGRAVVIGTSSFGKGTVQTVIRLPNGGEITLTWSRLITPSGYALHGLGVMPAICTSGAGGGERELIDRALMARMKTSTLIEAWRKADINNEGQRKGLRASCPAERRKKSVEAEVASRLIGNRSLYNRALGLTSAVDAAGRDGQEKARRP
ncbi:MAG TPA: S41 family peptidase [Rhodospirillales bacterium]|nr:S41 family peptidase [Rhodospirillales bacterium]